MHRKLIVALLSLLVVVVAVPAASAGAASGTLTIHTDTFGATPVRDARYAISGVVQPALAMSAQLGAAAETPAVDNTDERYVAASLTVASEATMVFPCTPEDPVGTIAYTVAGVYQPKAAMSVQLVLDLLHGRGSVQFGVADSPDYRSPGRFFAPGLANRLIDNTCPGQEQRQTVPMPVFSHTERSLFDDDTDRWILQHQWPLRRTTGGAWTAAGSIHRATGEMAATTVGLNLSVAGSGTSLHARCVPPTVRDLRRARSQRAARRIASRAGFPRVRVSSKRTVAAPRRHWYIAEQIGGGTKIPCGARLHLVKSLGRS